MSYKLPTNDGQLIVLGNHMVHGLTLDGVALGITQVTAAQLQTTLTAFINASTAYNGGRSARQVASDAYQASTATLSDWLGVVRSVLAGQFGPRWNTGWAQAGFTSTSSAVPRTLDDQFGLAQRLVGFFTSQPGYEVASMQVTAARGQSLLGAVTTAKNALTAATGASMTRGEARTSALTVLTDRMWSLMKILQATLNDDDVRWLDFGLPLPGTPSTPGQPVNVTAMLDDRGAILVQCDAVPLATRYRWRTLLVGAQDKYQLAESTTEPMGSLTGVQPGQAVQIFVQAVNGSLQGVASAAMVFTMPQAETRPKTTEPKQTSNGNGLTNGNGHGNGQARLARQG